MSGRGVLFVSVLAAAIAGPYFLSSSENRQGLNKWWESLRAASRGGSTDGDAEPAHSWVADAQLSDAWRLVSRLAGEPPGVMPVGSYRPTVPLLTPQQLFRFDVTPSWIVNNWPRVTTQLTEGELEGLRVTVVTGTGVQDLTGSLTYYFDKQQQLQRILFRGYTGDPRPLVALLSQQYGLKLDPELGAWVLTARWNGSPTHLLHIQHVPIVDAGNPRQQGRHRAHRRGADVGDLLGRSHEEIVVLSRGDSVTRAQQHGDPDLQRLTGEIFVLTQGHDS
jgi:hypothetical protein